MSCGLFSEAENDAPRRAGRHFSLGMPWLRSRLTLQDDRIASERANSGIVEGANDLTKSPDAALKLVEKCDGL